MVGQWTLSSNRSPETAMSSDLESLGTSPGCPFLYGTLVRKMSDEAAIQLVVPRRLRKSLFDLTFWIIYSTPWVTTDLPSTQSRLL